ncbi:MAG: hypothetical protein ACD_72C00274G0001, partial [uncultured bacterium]
EYRAAIDWENQHIHQLYSRLLVEKILKEKFQKANYPETTL